MNQQLRVRAGLVVVLVSLIAVTGCVSKKQYRREVGALNTQVSALSQEVYRIDSAVKESQSQKGIFGFGQKTSTAASSGSAYTPMYRTPSGFEVPAMDIQNALKSAGYYTGPIDGEIGPDVRDAIRKFQQDNGLGSDGVVGRRTWEKLKTHLSSSASSVIK